MDVAEMDARLAEWERAQPAHERSDPLWELVVYRLARFAMDCARDDACGGRGSAAEHRSDQMLRAVVSICANIAEGYSRPTSADRARFFAYALGSAREAMSWYASLRGDIEEMALDARMAVLARIRRLTFGLLKSAQRTSPRSSFKF